VPFWSASVFSSLDETHTDGCSLIPVVLVLVFLGPKWQWLFTLAVAAVSVLAGWEYLGLTQRCGASPPRIL